MVVEGWCTATGIKGGQMQQPAGKYGTTGGGGIGQEPRSGSATSAGQLVSSVPNLDKVCPIAARDLQARSINIEVAAIHDASIARHRSLAADRRRVVCKREEKKEEVASLSSFQDVNCCPVPRIALRSFMFLFAHSH